MFSVDDVVNLQQQVVQQTRECGTSSHCKSACLLGSFLVSASLKLHEQGTLPPLGEGSHLKSLMVFGDALKANNELRRAIDVYRQALQQRKNCRGNATSSMLNNVLGRGAAPGVVPDTGVLDATIKLHIAECHEMLKEHQVAKKVLESIPSRYRTTPVLLLMGRLCEFLGIERATANTYRDALKQNPYAMEAILALLQFGAPVSEVLTLVAHNPHVSQSDVPWLTAFVEAHGSFHNNQYSESLEKFDTLESTYFPNNTHLLTQMGNVQVQKDDHVSAIIMFQRARTCDPKALEGMDVYASLIRSQLDSVRLNNLTRELLSIDVNRPEPWMAAAYCSDLVDEPDRAMHFVDKALAIDPQHLLAYQFRGKLQLSLGQAEQSVGSFFQAYTIRRDFSSYKGLVNAYLAIPRLQEALRTAKEALQLMPKDSRAVLIVGNVLARSKDGAKKAIKAYSKAVKLNPLSYEAAIALSDLYLMLKQSNPDTDINPAIEVMQQCIQHHNKDFMHTKLADLFTANRNYAQALTHYHNALSLCPGFDFARHGIERLEKIMRGMDPDMDEDGEMDQGDHDDYDQDM